jgi:hypothetical protein
MPSCTWIGHCLGDSCSNPNDCDQDFVCKSGVCSSPTSEPVCTWIGHCLGDSCSNLNGCDQDWVCKSGVCSLPTSEPVCTWIGHCLGDSCSNLNDCDHDWVCSNSVCIPYYQTPTSTTFTSPTTYTVTTTSTVSASDITIPSTPTAASSSHDDNGFNKSAVIGIAVGIPVGLILIAIIVYLFWRRRPNQAPPVWNSRGQQVEKKYGGIEQPNTTRPERDIARLDNVVYHEMEAPHPKTLFATKTAGSKEPPAHLASPGGASSFSNQETFLESQSQSPRLSEFPTPPSPDR